MVVDVMNEVGLSLFYSEFAHVTVIARHIFGECGLETIDRVYTAIRPFMDEQQHTLIAEKACVHSNDTSVSMLGDRF